MLSIKNTIFQELPIWTTCHTEETCVEIANVDGSSMNMVLDKEYALDSVVSRVSSEKKFSQKDEMRILSILDKLYSNSSEASDLR